MATNPLVNATNDAYVFPSHRLVRRLRDDSRTPLVLVACGSYSPITYLHLRMFEMARDHIKQQTNFELVGGYLSPVNDAYKKPGLISAAHRVNMCSLATEMTSNWLMIDPWEAYQPKYQPTAVVLDHFDHQINEVLGGVETSNGERKRVRIMLLAGSDLINTMSEPGVWSPTDLDRILGRYGTFIIERAGSDLDQSLENLTPWRDNIYLVRQTIQNDVSSTKVRLFLKRGMSVRYLLPNPVVDYIEANGLYLDDGPNASASGPTYVTTTASEYPTSSLGSSTSTPLSNGAITPLTTQAS